jgi:hypothetical protein
MEIDAPSDKVVRGYYANSEEIDKQWGLRAHSECVHRARIGGRTTSAVLALSLSPWVEQFRLFVLVV